MSAKSKSSLFDLLNDVRAIKQLLGEVKDLSPEITGFIKQLGIGKNIDPSVIKNAMNFAISKFANDPYTILGVDKDDPKELVDAVFRVKVKFYHPDNILTGNQEKFIKISEAYEKIRNGEAN